MRHDPASAAVVVMLRGLKMYGMAQAVGELIEQGAPAFEASVPVLSQLLKAEMAEREVRSIAYQIKAARFPAYKDLTGFDFAVTVCVDPYAELAEGGICSGDLAVVVGVERRQCIEAIARSLAIGQYGRATEQFGAVVDLAVAIDVHHQQALSGTDPAVLCGRAGTHQIETVAVGGRYGLHPGAAEVQHDGRGSDQRVDLVGAEAGHLIRREHQCLVDVQR